LSTEPGWNQHSAGELKIDSFEADRAPGHAYQTMNLAGLFVRERGLFMFPQNKAASITMGVSRHFWMSSTAITTVSTSSLLIRRNTIWLST
jgi:hypothetical protein